MPLYSKQIVCIPSIRGGQIGIKCSWVSSVQSICYLIVQIRTKKSSQTLFGSNVSFLMYLSCPSLVCWVYFKIRNAEIRYQT